MAQKKDMHTTPKGIFNYPRLNKPDTKFGDNGKYKVNLIIPSEEAAELMQLITDADTAYYQEVTNKARQEKKKPPVHKPLPFSFVTDLETGEETGDVEFKFSMNASGIDAKTNKAWQRRPMIYDAKKAVIDPEKVQIWGGSEGRVSFFVHPYTNNGAGISLKLEAVQVTKLVSGGGRSAEAYGFDEEEGYAVEDSDVAEDISAPEETKETHDGSEDF